MKNVFSRTNYITGFKALGVIMIVLAHLHYEVPPLPDLLYKFFAFAGYFVVLFFILSAYTIALSIDKNPEFRLIPFMKRRFLRLAPAYFALIPIGILFRVMANNWQIPSDLFKDLILHLTFLNLNLIYEPSQSSFLGFEWMVPMLFWFYLLIPLLMYLIRKRFVLFVGLFAFSIFLHTHLSALIQYRGIMAGFRSMQVWIVMYTYTILVYELEKRNTGFFKTNNLLHTCLRILGVTLPVCYLLAQTVTRSERMYGIGLVLLTVYVVFLKPIFMGKLSRLPQMIQRGADNADVIILMGVVAKYMMNIYYIKTPHIIMMLWFTCLLAASKHRPFLIRFLFENRLMLFIGTISYALYLDHNLAITLAGYLVSAHLYALRISMIVVVAIGVAYFVHKHIEIPTGKSKAKR